MCLISLPKGIIYVSDFEMKCPVKPLAESDYNDDNNFGGYDADAAAAAADDDDDDNDDGDDDEEEEEEEEGEEEEEATRLLMEQFANLEPNRSSLQDIRV